MYNAKFVKSLKTKKNPIYASKRSWIKKIMKHKMKKMLVFKWPKNNFVAYSWIIEVGHQIHTCDLKRLWYKNMFINGMLHDMPPCSKIKDIWLVQ